jgi:DNA-binding CsgD family transcriptional regulator
VALEPKNERVPSHRSLSIAFVHGLQPTGAFSPFPKILPRTRAYGGYPAPLCRYDVRRIFRQMTTLARRDIEAVLRFVHDACSLDGDALFTPQLVARLHELVPAADRVVYCELDWDRRRTTYIADQFESFHNPDGHDVYWHLHHQHAVCEYFARTGDFTPRKMSDLIRQREWRSRELYNDFYRPLQYELDFRLCARRGYTKTFLLHSSRRDFSERDRLVLELVQPYLQRIEEAVAGRRRVTADLRLTRREREILSWVERGKTNAEVAQILWISPGTVRKHLENAYEKLGVCTRTAAVARLRGR